QGVPVTALAVLLQHSPNVILSLPSAKIHSPQDLIGKRIMFAEGPYGAGTLSVLVKEGLSPSQYIHVPPTDSIEDLIAGKVDAMVGYVSSQAYQLRARGQAVNLLHPRQYGVDFYGDTLFTHQRRVEERPDEVRRFREATLQGWRYAIQNPDEIMDL